MPPKTVIFACFVTQSTLSAGLRELETLLGVTLVERTRRVVRFTALGERIAKSFGTPIRYFRSLDEASRWLQSEVEVPSLGERRPGDAHPG